MLPQGSLDEIVWEKWSGPGSVKTFVVFTK